MGDAKAKPPARGRPDALPDGPSTKRLLYSMLMQAAALAFIYRRMQDAGILEAVGSYVAVANPWAPPCGLLPHKEFLLLSDQVATPHGVFPGYVHVRGGVVAGLAVGSERASRAAVAAPLLAARPGLHVLDYGAAVVGPGLIDVHVHMNEPGRADWEGMETATAAAAAGGITTLVDMPLNSHPCTTTVGELRRKAAIAAARAANGTLAVDVGFWAGLVPDNARKPRELEALVRAGALGFKAFMAPSGIDDFAHVAPADVRAALPTLRRLGVPLLVHAELVDGNVPAGGDPRAHATWEASRPPRFERAAVRALIEALEELEAAEAAKKKPEPRPEGFKVHVVHISDAETVEAVDVARREGLPLTAETCPHYLMFSSDIVLDMDTRFKCAPPLRGEANRRALLAALAAGRFDGLATDHSPAPPEMKSLEGGSFMESWGGISGLQYALPASWEALLRAGGVVTPDRLHALWSRFPAALAGLSRAKGTLESGAAADIVVWDPEAAADTSLAAQRHRHAFSPWSGTPLRGRVVATFVGGSMVFDGEKGAVAAGEGGSCGAAVLGRRKAHS